MALYLGGHEIFFIFSHTKNFHKISSVTKILVSKYLLKQVIPKANLAHFFCIHCLESKLQIRKIKNVFYQIKISLVERDGPTYIKTLSRIFAIGCVNTHMSLFAPD